MSISDNLKAIGKGVYEGLLHMLDAQPDDKALEYFREGLRRIAGGDKIPKDRMRRLALLLAQAASDVAEELEEYDPAP